MVRFSSCLFEIEPPGQTRWLRFWRWYPEGFDMKLAQRSGISYSNIVGNYGQTPYASCTPTVCLPYCRTMKLAQIGIIPYSNFSESCGPIPCACCASTLNPNPPNLPASPSCLLCVGPFDFIDILALSNRQVSPCRASLLSFDCFVPVHNLLCAESLSQKDLTLTARCVIYCVNYCANDDCLAIQVAVQNALKNLEEFATMLRVLGSYPKGF